jgi:hypothetical protein
VLLCRKINALLSSKETTCLTNGQTGRSKSSGGKGASETQRQYYNQKEDNVMMQHGFYDCTISFAEEEIRNKGALILGYTHNYRVEVIGEAVL